MITVIIASVVLVVIAFAMFSVRILFKKNAEFRGTCASNNPYLQKEGVVCGVCGRKSDEPCGSPDSGTLLNKQVNLN